MQLYLQVLKKKYAVFEGRATRKEYWTFTLLNCGIAVIPAVIAQLAFRAAPNKVTYAAYLILILWEVLYLLATLLPALAVTVRRLHDTEHSWWWLLFALLVPGLGGIVLLVNLLTDSNPGRNKYGPNPKVFSRQYRRHAAKGAVDMGRS